MFYSFEAKRKLNKLIKATQPDMIYVLHYQNKISASIFDAAKKNKVPVVHSISDFGLICSNAHFYRPRQKDICERCLTGSKLNAVKYKCVHNSYVYSSVKAASLKFQEVLGVTKKIQAFVVPSIFTLEKLRRHGFPAPKLRIYPASLILVRFLKRSKSLIFPTIVYWTNRAGKRTFDPDQGF